ncbi:MAG TPA: HAMP domain-containing sensor histidine kinase [Acidothermaceae bacterium]|nr:HAMP domain-containing sensor histidine kinase [Acidothermaceae bacterium]
MVLHAHDVGVLVAVSAASSVVVTAGGLLLLKAARRRPVRDAALIVALTPVFTVVVAAIAATMWMFLSKRQFGVLIATVVFAGIGGVVTSMVLARTLMRGSDALRAAANALTRGEPYVSPIGTPSAELEALAAELEAAHSRLDEARRHDRAVEESRRELIAWVSHDLRTPLAGIRAMAEALEDNVVFTDEDRALYHRRIRVEVERLATMVDDLFELSRIHAGALQLSPRPMALAHVVREAVASATPVATAKGIHLAESGAETDGPLVDVDPYALIRVVGNLLGNAIRHTPRDGCVDIGMVHDDDFVYLSISDECGGIADVDIDRVFEVAFRGTPARTPAPDGGAGLGLAIARGIVNAHNGRIGAMNVGPGCRFTIALPRSREVHTFDSADQPNGRIRGDAESLT